MTFFTQFSVAIFVYCELFSESECVCNCRVEVLAAQN